MCAAVKCCCSSNRCKMILQEAAEIVKQTLGREFDDINIERVVVGIFFTGVKLSTGAGGMCYTPIKEIPKAVCCPSSAGRIFDPVKVEGMTAKKILSALPSREPIKTAVAIATLNALSADCWERGRTSGFTMEMNMDGQDAVRMPVEKSVAVIGAFVPTLRALKERGGTWWVIEQDIRTLKEDEMAHFVPAQESVETIHKADVLIITGVTLVNHTLEEILQHARSDAEIAVMGPTAGLWPTPLFDRGVRVVGGVWVKEPDELLSILARGGSAYHLFDQIATRIVMTQKN